MATPTPKEWAFLEREKHQILSSWFDIHFDTQVAHGSIQGAKPVSYGSTITGLAGSDGEVALSEAVLGYPAELSASTVYIASSSASDTDTYRVQGIDANGDYQDATVIASGTTPVAVTGTWDHVQSCVNTTAGGSNVGTVYVSTDAAAVPSTVGDQIQTAMLPGDNYAINPMIVCPNDTVITFHSFDFSTTDRDDCTITIEANRQGTWILNFKFFAHEAIFNQVFHTPLRLFEGDRLRVSVEVATGTAVGCTFGMNGNFLEKAPAALDRNKANLEDIFS